MGKRIPVVIAERLRTDLPEDKVSPQDSNAAADKHEPNPQPASVVNENRSGKNKEQTGDGEEDYPSNIKAIGEFFRHEPITAQWFFNGIVALFTALTFWATWRQYEAQLLEQRAWIGVESLVSHPSVPAVEQMFRIGVNFRNTGKTPARNVRTNIVVDPVTMPGEPNFSYQGEEIARAGMVAPSGAHFATLHPVTSRSTGKDGPLTAELLAPLQRDEQRLYVHGRVTYADIFGECHWMTFCYYLLAPDLTSFAICPDHNDTDDEECRENPQ